MNELEITLVALPPDAAETVRLAAATAFPRCRVVVADRLDAGRSTAPAESARLVVLTDADAAAASQLIDASGAPRFAIMVLGRDSSELAETVPPEDWNPQLLARVLRSTLAEHQLLCENLRLRGDLKTVARRVSHDLRSSLGCIHTSSDLLRETDAASLAGAASTIKQSSTEISHLIDRVSLVLKASADPIACGPVNMGEVVSGVLHLLAGEIAAGGAAVSQPTSWPAAEGVTSWLRVIWSNLLKNSLQHGGPKARIALAWQQCPGGLRFSVRDEGRGVDPERRASLFVPFDQLHLLRTGGVGLSVTQRLVALQGGHCGYESPAGGGSEFYFVLPARETVS